MTVAPTRTDPFARTMSEVIGGPVGKHGRPHRWWMPVRVVLAMFAVVFALWRWCSTQPCMETNWGNDQARYAKMCYSDVPYLYTGRGFAEAPLALRRSGWPVRGHRVSRRHRLLGLGRGRGSPRLNP